MKDVELLGTSEFKIMSNGNIKFLNIPLGEYIGIAMQNLSSYGINARKSKSYVEGKGNVVVLNIDTSLSFAKKCSLQIGTEWTGTKINEFKIFGRSFSEIDIYSIVNYVNSISKKWGLNIIRDDENEKEFVFLSSNDVFDMYLHAPKDKNGYVLMNVSLKNQIQDIKGDYNYKFITELYIDYLNRISKGNDNNKTIKKRCNFRLWEWIKSSKAIKFVLVIISIVVVYFIAYSYRYDTFKDKHMYMRYDRWLEIYEKYDQPTGTWERFR